MHKENDDYIIAWTSPDSWRYTVLLNCTRDNWHSDICGWAGKESLVRHCVCKQHDCSCLCMCVVTDAFRRAHRRREEEIRHRLSCWVRVLLCISRWPLKVALCHNTLVPTTPAAVKCHRPLLSASQPVSQLDSADNPPSPISKGNRCLIRLGFCCLFFKEQ